MHFHIITGTAKQILLMLFGHLDSVNESRIATQTAEYEQLDEVDFNMGAGAVSTWGGEPELDSRMGKGLPRCPFPDLSKVERSRTLLCFLHNSHHPLSLLSTTLAFTLTTDDNFAAETPWHRHLKRTARNLCSLSFRKDSINVHGEEKNDIEWRRHHFMLVSKATEIIHWPTVLSIYLPHWRIKTASPWPITFRRLKLELLQHIESSGFPACPKRV